MLGAYLNEVALVLLFLGIVLLASKVGKIGEAVGGLFERGAEPPAKTETGTEKPEGS
jgi:hypothetical protein